MQTTAAHPARADARSDGSIASAVQIARCSLLSDVSSPLTFQHTPLTATQPAGDHVSSFHCPLHFPSRTAPPHGRRTEGERGGDSL